MSINGVVWATFQMVDDPLQKLALMALADGVGPTVERLRAYYRQPDWDFQSALNWLYHASLIKVVNEITYFPTGPQTALWEDKNGRPL